MTSVHIHTPSEHRIKKDYFGDEIHFGHKCAAGNVTLLSLLLDVDEKHESKLIGNMLDNFKENSKSDFVFAFAELLDG